MWKFMQIEPQPARGALVEAMWKDPAWIAEEKYDGDRRIAQFCGDTVRFTGRRISVKDGLFVEKTTNIPHLAGIPGMWKHEVVPYHRPPKVLDGTVLDGEIVFNPENMPNFAVDGGRSKYVTSIMGSLPEEAIAKQMERGWLKYVVFDCLFYKGKDVRGEYYLTRRDLARQAVAQWKHPYAGLAAASNQSKTGTKRDFLDEILSVGGEGVILKHCNHTYGDKKLWVKYKQEWTADVVIMGYKDAKEMSTKVDGEVSMTKYAKAGMIGAVVCGQYAKNGRLASHLTEVATVSGMTDDLRRDFTDYPKRYIGEVIEIMHNGREPTGRFRHPRFKRFRQDKDAKDCVYREGEV